MGNDGGSIPTRRELVREPARQKTHSQLRDTAVQIQKYHWKICPLSKKLLKEPVVSDYTGRLYNKDSVLEWLLGGISAFGDGSEIIEGKILSLKDTVEVKFESLTNSNTNNVANGGEGINEWVCPVTRKELGPGVKSVYLVPCGHAFSESAVREVGNIETGCLTCNIPYENSNIIPINTIDESELQNLKLRHDELIKCGLTHSLKKATLERKTTKRKLNKYDGSIRKRKQSNLNNTTTAQVTVKVLEAETKKAKKRKFEMNSNLRSLFSEGQMHDGKNSDFMSRGYSIPLKDTKKDE